MKTNFKMYIDSNGMKIGSTIFEANADVQPGHQIFRNRRRVLRSANSVLFGDEKDSSVLDEPVVGNKDPTDEPPISPASTTKPTIHVKLDSVFNNDDISNFNYQIAPYIHAWEKTPANKFVKHSYEGKFSEPNPDICVERPLKLVILVTTSIQYFEKRNAIRMTWGRFATRNDVAVAFLIGKCTEKY